MVSLCYTIQYILRFITINTLHFAINYKYVNMFHDKNFRIHIVKNTTEKILQFIYIVLLLTYISFLYTLFVINVYNSLSLLTK